MPAESENIALVRRLMDEGFNRGNLAFCDELFIEDAVEHQAGNPQGRDGVKAVISTLRNGFSDFHIEIEDIVDADGTVWFRNRATGTNDGSFMGFPPSGRTVDITVYDQVRIENGRVVEHWGVPDRLESAMQLGHIPPPGAPHRS